MLHRAVYSTAFRYDRLGRNCRICVHVDSTKQTKQAHKTILLAVGVHLAKAYHLYLDDSGSRDLDRPVNANNGSRWFGLGGILVADKDEASIRANLAAFCERWNIVAPLHSYDIRNRVNAFSWLANAPEDKRSRFYDELTALITTQPFYAIACVIDRSGYNARYREKYGQRRWAMSKTAFTIVVERAAKFAAHKEHGLKVYFEQHSKKEDRAMLNYYNEMRTIGQPFNAETSAKYTPLAAEKFHSILKDCRQKKKSSPMVQLADLVLFPLCVGGYDVTDRAYQTLVEHEKIIDSVVHADQLASIGVKYSCFDQ